MQFRSHCCYGRHCRAPGGRWVHCDDERVSDVSDRVSDRQEKASIFRVSPMKKEKRCALDGNLYTHAEFLEFFGPIIGQELWNAAAEYMSAGQVL